MSKQPVKQWVTKDAKARRKQWIEEIRKLSGNFGDDSGRLEKELAAEVQKHGLARLLEHMRLCGEIPESFDHDSSEEKLYSKYTDILLSECFRSMGLKTLVIKERGDSSDVEVVADKYSFVADAKVFRLSRTAKNQKDFKVQAMDSWKQGKPHAMVVCPIHQLPTRSSQIYQQASARNVCVFTYSHLSVLCSFAAIGSKVKAVDLLLEIFKAVEHLNPSKDAIAYWKTVNTTMLGFDERISQLWTEEKAASDQFLAAAKEIGLEYLASERERIMRMTHQEAIEALIVVRKIDSKIQTIASAACNDLLSLE